MKRIYKDGIMVDENDEDVQEFTRLVRECKMKIIKFATDKDLDLIDAEHFVHSYLTTIFIGARFRKIKINKKENNE